MLGDIIAYVEEQRTLHSLVRQSLGASPSHGAAIMAISGRVADTTFRALLDAAPESLRSPPLLRLFGVVPQGDLAVGVAFQNWVAGRTKAASALLTLVSHLSLVDERGNLNLPAPTAQLVAGMSAAGDGEDDNDYDPLTRAGVAMVAGALAAPFRATGSDGKVFDWQDFANGMVEGASARGVKAFTRSDWARLLEMICLFARLQSLRMQALRSALGGGGSQARDVLQVWGGADADQEGDAEGADVFAAWAGGGASCQKCGGQVRHFPI